MWHKTDCIQQEALNLFPVLNLHKHSHGHSWVVCSRIPDTTSENYAQEIDVTATVVVEMGFFLLHDAPQSLTLYGAITALENENLGLESSTSSTRFC